MQALRYLWAKTAKGNSNAWHPLILHMLDVAATADAILEREPEQSREMMGAVLGMSWDDARPWVLFLIASHDLGKASPGFQCKRPDLLSHEELTIPSDPDTKINHAFVSQIALAEYLIERGWQSGIAELAADAVGCHHGSRAKPSTLDRLMGNRRGIGDDNWVDARTKLLETIVSVLKCRQVPRKETLTGPDFMLLAGLTSFADWIGSNEAWFSFGTTDDCSDLDNWFHDRKNVAERALDAIGWTSRTPLVSTRKPFNKVFGLSPRPLQTTMARILDGLDNPALILVEAPMGEGKTEAALYAHLELQRRFGHRGLYIALPTKATGNAMFERALKFLRNQDVSRRLDLQLVHGGALLSEVFQKLKITNVYDQEEGGEVRAGEWFTSKKKALLSEYGVGTIDQALLPVLPVRHNFVRLWGLANRVVIFDEIHAYDIYTGTLLMSLLRWLLSLGSSVVLLSATLPPSVRRKLVDVVSAEIPKKDVQYPRISVYSSGIARQKHFAGDAKRRLTVEVVGISEEAPSIRDELVQRLSAGGFGLALVNTVQRAQDLYELFPSGESLSYEGQRVGKRLSDGTDVFLHHARFPAEWREKREENVINIFGSGSSREGRKILIATQVAEQSLDLDFDLMVTDLAPIDLILQRAGRLWRHQIKKESRALSSPTLLVAGLSGDEPPTFGKPLWWGEVYREDMLLRSWMVLKQKKNIVLPDEIDGLVQTVYDELVEIPGSLQKRMEKAISNGEGESYSKLAQANQAIIGLPDDSSWNDPTRFVLYDEDDPGVHRALMAHTRLGEESVLAIPVWTDDAFDFNEMPDLQTAKRLFTRGVSLSRKNVVDKSKSSGVPEGWKKSSLLRNCFPLILNDQRRWTLDETVYLDEDLGVVYERKEE